MDTAWVYVLWGCAAYLLGSVSFGDIVARLARFPIRETGTGNPGAANIFREMGPKYAAAVMALDLAKGLAATLPAFLLDLPVWAGVAGTAGVLAGHFLPVFWGFRGGTGMVVAIGARRGADPARRAGRGAYHPHLPEALEERGLLRPAILRGCRPSGLVASRQSGRSHHHPGRSGRSAGQEPDTVPRWPAVGEERPRVRTSLGRSAIGDLVPGQICWLGEKRLARYLCPSHTISF